MNTKLTRRQMIREMGGMQTIHDELRKFADRGHAFDAQHAQFIKKYPNKWIAFYTGEVDATADSLKNLLKEMDRLGIPRRESIVKFMDTERRTLIL